MAPSSESRSLVDQWIFRIKSNRFLAVAIFLGICIAAIAGMLDSVLKAYGGLTGKHDAPVSGANVNTVNIESVNNGLIDNSRRTQVNNTVVRISGEASPSQADIQMDGRPIAGADDLSKASPIGNRGQFEPTSPSGGREAVSVRPDEGQGSRTSSQINGKRALPSTPPVPSKLWRFADGVFAVASPIYWTDTSAASNYPAVTVPAGFVVTLSSVSQQALALLPWSDSAIYGVVVHDYLYWSQAVSREDADEIFLLAEKDEVVLSNRLLALRAELASAGQGAWDQTAARKAAGEKRMIGALPKDAQVPWIVWAQQPGVVKE